MSNHDDKDFEVVFLGDGIPKVLTQPTKMARVQLLRSTQQYAHSLSREGPAHVFGVSNYKLPVYFGDAVAFQVILKDSGGGGLPQKMEQSKLGNWYQSYRRKGIDAVAYQHIPTREFQYHENPASCTGFCGEGVSR